MLLCLIIMEEHPDISLKLWWFGLLDKLTISKLLDDVCCQFSINFGTLVDLYFSRGYSWMSW